MQGKSAHKTHCGKYRHIGDGIQANCIAGDGSTYDFYFRNASIAKKWLDKGVSYMHACIFHMVSSLRDIGHSCKVYTLFNSVLFARESFALTQKMKTDGVLRKSSQGVHLCVMQEE